METYETSTATRTNFGSVIEETKTSRAPRMIYYNQKRIVYIDFSNLKKPEEIYTLMADATRFISANLPISVLTLTNLSGMHFNNEIFNRFISYVKSNSPYVKASAVVGMSGMMQIFYNSFTKLTGRNVKAFSTELEAKKFLADD
ncbi:MAG: hypothetical protein K9H26_13035 [Prolixibacteraceae bacterium]|nr:hypothetical protein [Prolixibacteraceae bacterium]